MAKAVGGVSISRAWRVPTLMLLRRPLRREACWRGFHPPGLAGAYPRAVVTTSSWRRCLPACCCDDLFVAKPCGGVSIPRTWRVPTRVLL